MKALGLPGLRPATALDVPAVLRLIAQAYGDYPRLLGVRPGPLDDDYPALIAQHRVQVIDRDGALQALLVLIPQVDAMLLDNIAVAPAAQGQGLGRALLRYAEAVARDAGLPRMRLYTHVGMTENQAIYSHVGYVQTHRETERGLDRVYMEKPLGP